MLIGEDYPKIEFEMFGLELLEPMAFITDSLLAILAFVLAYKVSKIRHHHNFYRYWFWFFALMGIATITGGIAHLMYNYWGTAAKFPSWIIAPIAMYCLEQATISVHPKKKTADLLKKISVYKYFIVLAAWLAICFALDLSDPANEKKPFIPLALNSGVGAVYCTVFLTYKYSKWIEKTYIYFTYGTLIALPSIVLIIIRIHPHRWFNGEDLGHIMMMCTYIFSYIAIKKVDISLVRKD